MNNKFKKRFVVVSLVCFMVLGGLFSMPASAEDANGEGTYSLTVEKQAEGDKSFDFEIRIWKDVSKRYITPIVGSYGAENNIFASPLAGNYIMSSSWIDDMSNIPGTPPEKVVVIDGISSSDYTENTYNRWYWNRWTVVTEGASDFGGGYPSDRIAHLIVAYPDAAGEYEYFEDTGWYVLDNSKITVGGKKYPLVTNLTIETLQRQRLYGNSVAYDAETGEPASYYLYDGAEHVFAITEEPLDDNLSSVFNEATTLYYEAPGVSGVTKLSEEGEYAFSLAGGESITFPEIPAGYQYEVVELEDEEYNLVSKTNDAGVMESNTTAVFVNEKKDDGTDHTDSGEGEEPGGTGDSGDSDTPTDLDVPVDTEEPTDSNNSDSLTDTPADTDLPTESDSTITAEPSATPKDATTPSLIAKVDKPATKGSPGKVDKAVATGDNLPVAMLLALMSVAGCSAFAMCRRRFSNRTGRNS